MPGADSSDEGQDTVSVRYLRISVTDRCDLRCVYCMPMRTSVGAPREDLLTYEEIGRVARAAVKQGVRKVRITGGEPLRRPGIASLLRDLASIDGIEDRGVTTNGTCLADSVPVLAETGYRVNVHLDTLDPTRYRDTCGAPSPEPVVRGLDAALAAGIRVKINSVCTARSDLEDARRLVLFGLERGVDVRFIESMPVSGTEPDWNARRTIESLETGLRDSLGLESDGGDGVARMYRLPGTAARVGFITPSHAAFCSGCDKLRLSSRGRLRTCLFAREGTDLRPLLRAGDQAGLLRAIAGALTEKDAGGGRQGCRIETMVGIGG